MLVIHYHSSVLRHLFNALLGISWNSLTPSTSLGAIRQMPRLNKELAPILSELRLTGARNLPPGRLGQALMETLERAIGWDGYRLFGVDSRTLLINRLLAASDNDRLARREWLEEVYLDERNLPYLHLHEMLRARLRAAAYQSNQKESWGFPRAMLEAVEPDRHRTYYFESQSPVGGNLQAGFESNGRQIAILQAYRRDPGSAFRPNEVAIMRAATPLVGTALGFSLAREQALAEHADQWPSGIVFIGADRSIAFSTPAGDKWLDQLHAIESRVEDVMPIAMWAAAKRFAERRSPSLQMEAMTPLGPVSLEATDGGADTIAIVVSAHRPEPALELPHHWGLTPQQAQIALQVITGASNREIAQRFFVSEHTVEWHLRKIYRALDVSSRTQLQARFFHHVGLPNYQDD